MTDPIYPIVTNAGLVGPDTIATYLRVLFEHVEWGDRVLGLRGIGEKGTPREGRFKEPRWFAPEHTDILALDKGSVVTDALRWAQWHAACFIVPAVLHPSAAVDGRAELEHIAEFTTIVVDYDSGDTRAGLAHAEAALGRASMVVLSGGTTEAGAAKLHAYWRLSEPSTEIEHVAGLRKLLALKTGGDPSFGRAPQIVRVAGTVHAKGGNPRQVVIERVEDTWIELGDAAEAIEAMQPLPGLPVASSPLLEYGTAQAAAPASMGGMDFGPGAAAQKPAIGLTLQNDVHEGGTDEKNRWSEFSRVAGWEIHLARVGEVTLAQAIENTRTWVHLHMIPPWPDQRIHAEFQGLLNKNIQQNGPMPAEILPAPDLGLPGSVSATVVAQAALGHWDIGSWAMGPAKPRRHLVQGLIMAGVPHVLAADGGVGKTFLMLDLSLRVAAAGNSSRDLTWLGQPITHEAAGGTVVLITTEDSMDELHIRLADIDPTGELRAAAAGRLRIVPLINAGGAFPLVAYDARHQPGQSPKWAAMYQAIAEIHRMGGRVSVVGIDTMASTLHGEDISAAVVSEYYVELSRLCGELGCAAIVSQHTRKTNSQTPIKTLEDMRAALRGSGAVVNSSRASLGVWPATDYGRRMRGMGMKPEKGRLYMMGVVKANNPEMLEGTKTLLRAPSGLLEDVTERDGLQKDGVENERMAWLVVAVREAALARYPLPKTGANGLYRRRAELPDCLQTCSRNELEGLCQRALGAKLLVAGSLADSKGGHRGYLDVPGGPIDRKQGYQDPGVWKPDWSVWEYDPTIGDVVLAG